jgi:hypothetical protein
MTSKPGRSVMLFADNVIDGKRVPMIGKISQRQTHGCARTPSMRAIRPRSVSRSQTTYALGHVNRFHTLAKTTSRSRGTLDDSIRPVCASMGGWP